MTTAILVGAGASLAEAPSNLSRAHQPPLDATFFRLCRLARLDGRRTVQRYMWRHYGLDPLDGGHTMEEIFNYIYEDAFSPHAKEDAYVAYSALVRMYQEAIARTTNGLSGNSRRGVGALLRHLWKNERETGITFVTFNQDLLIEKAIDRMAHLRSYTGVPWDIRECYTIDFRDFVGAGGPFLQATTVGESLQILKLHGSLNWVYKVRSGEDPQNYIRRVPRQLYCVTDVDIQTSYRYRENRRQMPVIPFVVPPIYDKNSQYQEVISPIWYEAEQVLSGADRLIIFGYSFPTADFAARHLLRKAFHANVQLREATVIDPASSAAQRLADLLEAASISHHRSVQGFINANI